MPRENEGYRETLAQLCAIYPGRMALSQKEVAGILGCSVRTVQRTEGIPRLSTGGMARYPIEGLARWMTRRG